MKKNSNCSKLIIYKLKSFSLILFLIGCFFCHTSCLMEKNEFDNSNFIEVSISKLSEGYNNGEFTIYDVTKFYIDRINQIDKNGPQLNSIIQINPDALKTSKLLDEEIQNGKIRSRLHGIPIVLKDNIDTSDKMPTTAGSRAMIGSFPLKDSYLVKKLRTSGAVILGKANLSEWANFRGKNSSSGWSGVGGQTKNPYFLNRNPCGSSSGSAVAVSANLTLLAIGTETNGSIVCPSTTNGIVGIKPTVGLISRSGIIPISYTQDTAGPMARTLEDAVIALGILTGIDNNDPKTLKSKSYALNDYTSFLKLNGIKGKRIGLFKKPLGINEDVDRLFYKSIDVIKDLGAEVIEIDKLNSDETRQMSFKVMLHEYKDGLNKYFKSLGKNAKIKSLEQLIDFNKKDSIELKFYNQLYLEMANNTDGMKSKTYIEAHKNLMRLSRDEGIDKVMEENNLDAIVSPTGNPAWSTDWINGDRYLVHSSSPAAWAGYPNITIPMGDVHGLPVGISFFGKAWSEPTLIEIAYSFEQKTKARIIPQLKLNLIE